MQFNLSAVFPETLHGSLSVSTLCPEHDSYHGKTGRMQAFCETKLPHSASWWKSYPVFGTPWKACSHSAVLHLLYPNDPWGCIQFLCFSEDCRIIYNCHRLLDAAHF